MSSHPPEEEDTRVATIDELQSDLGRPQSRDKAYLIVLAGSNVGEMYRLDEIETVIGRGTGSTIRLNDDGISRRHARLLQVAGEVLIEDLKSSNGTHVNGEQIGQVSLHDGDKIRLGATTILKFTYHDRLDETFQQQMYEAALRDPLTKAYNKRYFGDRLDTELAFARRHKTRLSLILIDIDHFARYGGEEFAVLCRGSELAQAGTLAERIRTTVEATPFEHEGKLIPVTISAGVAEYPTLAATTPAELIAGADEALYNAKNAGRNRVLLKQ
jgi:GGDEF domain-containing protein